jgi:hypothetical protein
VSEPTIKLKSTRNAWRNEYTASDLVQYAVEDATYRAGQLERLELKIDKLSAIVGRLMARLPPDQWLDIVECYSLVEDKS